MPIVACACPADDDDTPRPCPNLGHCDQGYPSDPDEWCPACRADYDTWLDAQADASRWMDRYETAPAGWDLEALCAPCPN